MADNPEVKYEYVINGKAVRFKERVPMSAGHVMRRFLRNTNSDDYNDDVFALRLLLEPCELVPEPSAKNGFEHLDTFSEMVPLIQAAADHVVAKIVAGRSPN